MVSVEDSEVKNIVESVQRLGEVQMLGSLQIVELVEQAGGILVQWDEVKYSDFVDKVGLIKLHFHPVTIVV